jgi:glycosyltransferase involved in cell wall biosynthesis
MSAAAAPQRAPVVSVLMTTFNGAGFIGASIASVLAQSFADFELIVVDDGSTDATPVVLAGIGDKRLRVLRQAMNGGVVSARNVGFLAARGRFVAALDHDDLSHPERLARQVAYLDAYPEVVMVATEIEIEEAAGRRKKGRVLPLPLREGVGGRGRRARNVSATPHGPRHAPDHPTGGDPALIRWLLHVDNPLTWSSVMFRADAVRRLGAFMRPDYELADDFDLYHRLLAIGEIARLDEVLTVYRWHARNTSHGREDALNANAVKVLEAACAPLLGADAQDAATLVIRHLSDRKPVRDAATLARLGGYLTRLLVGFGTAPGIDAQQRATLASVTGTIWWRCVRAAARSGVPGLLGQYRAQSALSAAFRPSRVDLALSALVGLARSRFS